MATAGRLEIHSELAHKAGAPAQPDPEPVAGAPVQMEAVPLERPRKAGSSNRTAVPVLAFFVVVMLLAGVAAAFVRGNEPTVPATPLAMVQASASTTADSGTARVSATVKGTSGPLVNGITLDGGFDFDSRRARLDVDPSKFGVPGVGKIEAIVDYSAGLIMYMKFPTQFSSEFGGKPWVKMDVGAFMKQAGFDVDLGALAQGQSNDPTSGLELLRGADTVVTVGTEDVRGTPTTHYRLVVNVDKAIAEAPADQRDALTKLQNLSTTHTFPLDVWLDGDGRVRRFQQTIDPSTIHLPANIPAAAT